MLSIYDNVTLFNISIILDYFLRKFLITIILLFRSTLSELNLIRKLHDLCDVVINVGNRKIYAHKVSQITNKS